MIPSYYLDSNGLYADGGVYWLGLEVSPDFTQAESIHLTLRAPLPHSREASPTASEVQTSTSLSTPTGLGSSAGPTYVATIYRTATLFDSSQPTTWQTYSYQVSSYDVWQSMDPSAKVGIVIAGVVLGICLLVLIGVSVYRKRRSSATYCEPGEDQDTAVEGLPEQQAGSDAPEKDKTYPNTQIVGDTGVQRHTAANANLYEME